MQKEQAHLALGTSDVFSWIEPRNEVQHNGEEGEKTIEEVMPGFWL